MAKKKTTRRKTKRKVSTTKKTEVATKKTPLQRAKENNRSLLNFKNYEEDLNTIEVKQSNMKYNKDCPAIAYELIKEGFKKVELAKQLGIDLSTLDAWIDKHPEFSNAVQRGAHDFYKRLPELVIDHLSKGFGIQSFGGTVRRGHNFILELKKQWPAFEEAINIGMSKKQRALESIAIKQSIGGFIDEWYEFKLSGGKAVRHPETGEIIKERKTMQLRTSDRMTQFLLKNCDEYRESKDESKEDDEIKEAVIAARKLMEPDSENM